MKAKLRYLRGFTLVETAIVLVIVGMLTAGGVSVLSSSADSARYKETDYVLEETKEALIEYYIQFGRLPCPSDGINGVARDLIEDTVTKIKTCPNLRGYLPYATLGLGGRGDAWGQPIKYVVNPRFTTFKDLPGSDGIPFALLCDPEEVSGIELNADGQPSINENKGLQIFAEAADRILIVNANNQAVAQNVAFVLLSTGKNGQTTNAGISAAFDGSCNASDIEKENCDNNSTLVSNDPLTDGSTVTFDDRLVWMSDVQLLGLLQKSQNCTRGFPMQPKIIDETTPSSGESTNTETTKKRGCTAGSSGNDIGLLALLFLAMLGLLVRAANRKQTR